MGVHLSRTYALRWNVGHHMEDVEIDIRSTSVATLQEVRNVQLEADGQGETRLAEILADHIKRWNLDDENGEPLPVSVESLYTLEAPVLAAIAREWHRAARGITAPLEQPSISTAPSVEESIPMDTL